MPAHRLRIRPRHRRREKPGSRRGDYREEGRARVGRRASRHKPHSRRAMYSASCGGRWEEVGGGCHSPPAHFAPSVPTLPGRRRPRPAAGSGALPPFRRRSHSKRWDAHGLVAGSGALPPSTDVSPPALAPPATPTHRAACGSLGAPLEVAAAGSMLLDPGGRNGPAWPCRNSGRQGRVKLRRAGAVPAPVV